MSAALNQTPVAVPPLDTVLLWLNFGAECEFACRSVFPELREKNSIRRRGGASLHLLPPARAAELLEDVVEHAKSAPGGVRTSYRGCESELRFEIAIAAARPAFARQATCTRASEFRPQWIGTKASLQRQLGLVDAERPWPGAPGSKRWIKVADARGYPCHVMRYSPFWPTLFRIEIEIPYEQSQAPKAVEDRREKVEVARCNLTQMITDARGYRLDLLARLREVVRQCVLEPATVPTKWHAFQLTDEAVAELMASFDAVTETLFEVEVLFDEQRHAAIERSYRSVIAGADEGFQGRLADLVKPKSALLDGGSR